MTTATDEATTAISDTSSPDAIPENSALSTSPLPAISHRSRWIAPLAFAAGGSLTALTLAVVFHNGAFDAVANTRPLPAASATVSDPRLDRLL